MAELHQIYSYVDKDGREHFGFGVDPETGELFWNKTKVVTEQRLTLSWWVNASIILGGLSTAFLAIVTFLDYLKPIP